MRLEAGKFYIVRMPDQSKDELLEVLATNVRPTEEHDDSDSIGIVWTKHRNKFVDWRVATWKESDNTTWDGEIEVLQEAPPPRHRVHLRALLTGSETEYKKG